MRRVLRHAFTILSALSLLLSVATCVLWVRSYFVADVISKGARCDDRQCMMDAIYSLQGAVVVYQYTIGSGPAPMNPQPGLQWLRLRASQMTPQSPSLPFSIMQGDGRTPVRWMVRSSYWLIVVLTALAPALWIRRRVHQVQRRRRIETGCCPACGYDLRESPERCLECGAVSAQTI